MEGVAEPQRERKFDVQVMRIEKALAGLNEAINSVEERFSPVLAQEVPPAVKGPEAERVHESKFDEFINVTEEHILSSTTHLKSIRERSTV